jgi:hypothetical protein
LSQTESTPKHFFLEKKHCINAYMFYVCDWWGVHSSD